MDNQGIAHIFAEIADMLDIQGENVFRINAYRRAAQIVEHYPQDLSEAYL
ncbi:hypothetical protein KAZ92_00730, partial [Candidatus Gracilibacteria bacterium]|nr:hypothetical protein [Candidatus Gracilibacteria bacterium]